MLYTCRFIVKIQNYKKSIVSSKWKVKFKFSVNNNRKITLLLYFFQLGSLRLPKNIIICHLSLCKFVNNCPEEGFTETLAKIKKLLFFVCEKWVFLLKYKIYIYLYTYLIPLLSVINKVNR